MANVSSKIAWGLVILVVFSNMLLIASIFGHRDLVRILFILFAGVVLPLAIAAGVMTLRRRRWLVYRRQILEGTDPYAVNNVYVFSKKFDGPAVAIFGRAEVKLISLRAERKRKVTTLAYSDMLAHLVRRKTVSPTYKIFFRSKEHKTVRIVIVPMDAYFLRAAPIPEDLYAPVLQIVEDSGTGRVSNARRYGNFLFALRPVLMLGLTLGWFFVAASNFDEVFLRAAISTQPAHAGAKIVDYHKTTVGTRYGVTRVYRASYEFMAGGKLIQIEDAPVSQSEAEWGYIQADYLQTHPQYSLPSGSKTDALAVVVSIFVMAAIFGLVRMDTGVSRWN